MADQMRADALSITGSPAATPNMDRIASQGVWFSNCVTNSPMCVSARVSLATGQYPQQTGVWANVPYTLDPAEPIWMKRVRDAGYLTAVFGKTHLHPHEGDLRDRVELVQGYGFDTVDETPGPWAATNIKCGMTDEWERLQLWDSYRADLSDRLATKRHVVRPSTLGLDEYYDSYVARGAKEWLASRADGEPWFCWVSFGGPHEPWDAPQPYASLFKPADMMPAIPRSSDLGGGAPGLLHELMRKPSAANPGFEEGDVAALRADYAGLVALIDDEIGEILSILEERKELQNTIVIVTSDHGEMNGDHGLLFKSNFLDPAVFVPLIVKPPDDDTASSHGRCDALVELMDVGPTLLDYAGAPSNGATAARSLRPLIEGACAAHRDYAFSQFRGSSMVLTQEWKLVLNADGAASLLFNRFEDLQETRNLAGQPKFDSVIADFRSRFAQFRMENQVAQL